MGHVPDTDWMRTVSSSIKSDEGSGSASVPRRPQRARLPPSLAHKS